MILVEVGVQIIHCFLLNLDRFDLFCLHLVGNRKNVLDSGLDAGKQRSIGPRRSRADNGEEIGEVRS